MSDAFAYCSGGRPGKGDVLAAVNSSASPAITRRMMITDELNTRMSRLIPLMGERSQQQKPTLNKLLGITRITWRISIHPPQTLP